MNNLSDTIDNTMLNHLPTHYKSIYGADKLLLPLWQDDDQFIRVTNGFVPFNILGFTKAHAMSQLRIVP